MKRSLSSLMASLAVCVSVTAHADTVAHWRFETGPANTNIIHTIGAGQFEGTIQDVSGNGNHLSVWEQGGGAGYQYRSDVPVLKLPGSNLANNFSVKNTGGGPAMFTTSTASLPSGIDIETMTPTAFTIEASYKPQTSGHRTVVGRDGRGVATADQATSSLYLQIRPDNSAGILFVDVAGNTHSAFSAPGLIQGYNNDTDPNGITGNWYNLVGVSDGASLKMYVNNQLVATTNFTSANPGLAVGTGGAGDWHAGEFSVGRGLHNGNHVDRAFGFIDEVRISNSALNPLQFLTPSALSLTVNKSTGAVTLKNNASFAVDIDFYSITSGASALNFAGWNSLDDQNFMAVDSPADPDSIGGNSPGEGWDEAAGSSPQQLIEQFLRGGGSNLTAGQSLNLGNAYNTSIFGGTDGDLAFTYSYNGGAPVTGAITYEGTGGIPGDFDNNGKVNGNDFLVWQRGLGTTRTAADLVTWRNNFGAGAAAEAAAGVPEPATFGMLVIAGTAVAFSRRRRLV